MVSTKSLGKLISRLVDEVALRGKAGALPSDIFTRISAIYKAPSGNDSHLKIDDLDEFMLAGETLSNLDDSFLEYVWRLLIRNPDIFLEKYDLNDGVASGGTNAKAIPHTTHRHMLSDEGSTLNPSTFTASTTKVLDSNLAAERVIDAHASGTSAPENASGRSVTATSREGIDDWTDVVEPSKDNGKRLFASESRIWHTIAGHEPDYSRIPGLDFVCLSLIAACGPPGIAQNDLVRLSGQDKRSLPMRTDRLHEKGYIIKRPVTIFQNKALLHTSLLVLKRFAASSEATAVGLTEAATKFQKSAKTRKRRTAVVAPDSSQEQSLILSSENARVHEDNTMRNGSKPNEFAQWTPYRNLWNQVFDVVHESGLTGLTLNGITAVLTGSQYRKPMENLLAQLTNSWQLSQPLHLRHLAIVRDSVQRGKTSVYLYHTCENYHKLVDAGQRTWEAVLMLQDSKKKSPVDMVIDARLELDQYGFPSLDPNHFQGLHNNAPLIDCVPTSRTFSKTINVRVHRKSNAKERAVMAKKRSPLSVNAVNNITSTNKRTKMTAVREGLSCPRKITTASMPADIEYWNVGDIRGFIESRRLDDLHLKTNITDEIQRRTQHGEQPSVVAHDLLEATDALQKAQGQQPVSRFLAMQIMHEYAGGPEPGQEDEIMMSLRSILKRAEAKEISHEKRPQRMLPLNHASMPKKRTSMLANAGDRSTTSDSVGRRGRRLAKVFDENSVISDAIIKGGTPLDKASLYWRLPSVAAHSSPHRVQSSNFPVSQAQRTMTKTKKKSRPRNTADLDGDSTTGVPTFKRRKTAASNDRDSVTEPISPTPNLRSSVPTRVTSESSHLADESLPRTIHSIMFEKYMKAAESVSRTHEGVFVTRTAQRYRRRDDPIFMSSKKYQVVIFRMSALKHLKWFTSEHQTTLPSSADHQQMLNQAAGRQISNIRPLGSENLMSPNSSATWSPSEDDGTLRFRERSTNFPYQELLDNSKIDSNDTNATQPVRHSLPLTETRRQVEQSPTFINATQVPAGVLSSHLVFGAQASISRHRPEAYLSEDMNKDPSSLTSSQDPSCFVFKIPGLQRLDWFQHGSFQAAEVNHSLLHDQADPSSVSKTQQLSTLGQSDAIGHKASLREKQQSTVLKNARAFRESRVPGTSGRTGGSTAILRREIVMQLVKTCGGVFPEAAAMRVPFSREWRERGQSGIPERNTVINAVNMCCEQGKLRRIVFSFKNRYGITGTSTVFALPEIDPGDRKVKGVQEMVKLRHPQLFVPHELTLEDTPDPKSRKSKRQRILPEAAEKQAKVDEAKAMAMKSLEERETYLAALQSSDLTKQEKAALTSLAEPSAPKLQRLETIRKPWKSSYSLPVSSKVQGEQIIPGKEDLSVSQNQAIHKTIVDALQPSSQESRRVSHTRKVQDGDLAAQNDRTHQTLAGSTRNAANIEFKQCNNIEARPYIQNGYLHNPASAPQEYVVSGFMDPVIETLEVNGTFSATYSGTQIVKVFPRQPTRGRKRKHAEIGECIFPGFMDPTFIYHRATGTFSTTFPGFRRGMMKLNFRGKKRRDLRSSLPHGYQSPFQNRHLAGKAHAMLRKLDPETPRFPGFMGANTLHPISGTFSANFQGFRAVRPHIEQARIRRAGKWLDSNYTNGASNEETLTVIAPPTRHVRKRRRASPVAEGNGLDRGAEPSPRSLIVSPFKLRRVRGPQTAKRLGEDGALRLSVAVMVVRILTGGIRMNIDWTLVVRAFEPLHDESFLRSRWSSVLSQMRHNQVKMDMDFQTLFAKAYREGAVPRINFERLQDYDWKWLVEWTMSRLDAPTNSVPELSADRSSFDLCHTIRDAAQEKDLSHFYELEGISVRDLRRTIINRQAYVSHPFPLRSTLFSSKVSWDNEQIAIARSWIRANIITPIEAYDSQIASNKLKALSSTLVEAALKSLFQEKIIVERSKIHIFSDREYEMSDYFEKRLRTNICPAQFHRAVGFKAQLDLAIKTEGRARWSHLAHDGDAMALINLVAHQRVRLVPIDPPLNEWGHTDDGYASRQMDKSKLNFEMEIFPTPSYTMGNPLEPLPPPPAPPLSSIDHQFRKIPIWYDMNENLISNMWTSVLAAVLGLLAIRSGVTIDELHVNVRPSLEMWEVGEILNWMIIARVAERVGKRGYRTQEWWWMTL